MRKNDYKKSNKFILKSFLLTLFIVIFVNYTIDPFCLFGKRYYFFNKQRSELKRQERLTKLMKIEKDNDHEVVFAGTSRADNSLPDDYYRKLTGKKAFNLAVRGANFSEIKYLINVALETQPKLSRVIIAIDPDLMYDTKEKSISDIEAQNKNLMTKYFTVLLSFDAFESSFLTVIKSLNKKYIRGYMPNGTKRIFHNKDIRLTYKKAMEPYIKNTHFKEPKPNLIPLRDYIKELESKGVEVIIYAHPAHSVMYEIIKQGGNWEKIGEFKKELAKIKPFYDFYYPSQYSNEKISSDMKYFFENSHCTYLLGEKIFDKLILNKGDYGHFITSENVDYFNKADTDALIKWEKENPSDVAFVKKVLAEGK